MVYSALEAMPSIDSQFHDNGMSSAQGVYDSDSIATMQRRLRLGTFMDMAWSQGQDASLSNMALHRPTSLVASSEHIRQQQQQQQQQPMSLAHRQSWDGQLTLPSQHISSQWNNPSSVGSSPRSHPLINVTPPQPLDELPSLDSRYPPTSTSYDSSRRYSLPEDMPYHHHQHPTSPPATVPPQKFTADWVEQLNQMSFEPVIIDSSSQDAFLSGALPWDDPQHPSSELVQLPAASQQLWSNPQWAAMHSHTTNNNNNNLSPPPIDQSFYHISSTSSPFSSAPQSPAQRDYLSISPLTTPSLSRNTTPDPAHPHPSPPISKGGGSGGNGKMCSHCKATTTPLWRRDPRTQKQLCNACGLYLQQRNKLRPQQLIDADADEPLETPYDPNAPECSHCHTRNTSVWRRSKDGAQLCNACGVYRRLRGKDRPLSLRRNRIKPRTKHNTV